MQIDRETLEQVEAVLEATVDWAHIHIRGNRPTQGSVIQAKADRAAATAALARLRKAMEAKDG